jgi:hypothetical protein
MGKLKTNATPESRETCGQRKEKTPDNVSISAAHRGFAWKLSLGAWIKAVAEDKTEPNKLEEKGENQNKKSDNCLSLSLNPRSEP